MAKAAAKKKTESTNRESKGFEDKAKSQIENLKSLEDADHAMDELGHLQDMINGIEGPYRDQERRARAEMQRATEPYYQRREEIEKSLESFALRKRGEIFTGEEKSLDLRFGKIGFRFTPWKLGLLKGMTAAGVIMKLKAKGLLSMVRTIEEVNKQAALNLDERVLEKLGMKKSREELFFYKLNPRPPA